MDNPRSSAPTQPSCVNPGTGTNPPARQCSAHARPFSYSYYRQARMPRSSCWSRMPAGCGNAWHAASAGSRASLSRGDGLGGSPCGARRSAQVSVPQSRRPSQPTDLIHITMHFAGRRWVPGHRDCGQGGRLPSPGRRRNEVSRCGGDDTGESRRSLILADADDPAEHDQERELWQRRPARVGRAAVLDR